MVEDIKAKEEEVEEAEEDMEEEEAAEEEVDPHLPGETRTQREVSTKRLSSPTSR